MYIAIKDINVINVMIWQSTHFNHECTETWLFTKNIRKQLIVALWLITSANK